MVNFFKKRSILEQEEELKKKMLELENKKIEEKRIEDEKKQKLLQDKQEEKKIRDKKVKKNDKNLENNKKYIDNNFEERYKEEKIMIMKQQRKDLYGSMLYGMFVMVDIVILVLCIYNKKFFIDFLIPFNLLHVLFLFL